MAAHPAGVGDRLADSRLWTIVNAIVFVIGAGLLLYWNSETLSGSAMTGSSWPLPDRCVTTRRTLCLRRTPTPGWLSYHHLSRDG